MIYPVSKNTRFQIWSISSDKVIKDNVTWPNDKGLLIEGLDPATLNNKENAIRDRVLFIATKLWQNDAVLKAKIPAIESNQEPNLDTDWTT